MTRRGLPCTVAALVILAGVSMRLAAGEAATAQPVAAGQGVELGSLARLAQLEGQSGNGGAEEAGTAILAGYDKDHGFHIRSSDGNFLLKLKGQIQVRYAYKARETRGDEKDPGEIGKEDDSALELERMRFGLEGNILSPELEYKFLFDGDTDGGGAVRTLDGFVEYWAGKALAADDATLLGIGAGQMKAPFGLQETVSSTSMQMVDRSLANEFFNLDRALMVWARGNIAKKVYYAAAIANGIDSINVSPGAVDNIPAFIGRLNIALWGDQPDEPGRYVESNHKQGDLGTIGVSFVGDANNQSSGVGGLDYRLYQFGLDAALKTGLLSVQGEYFGRWVDYENGAGGLTPAIPGGDGSSNYAHGFYAQAGLLLSENFEVAGRVSAVWSDGPQDGNAFEAGPGFNWYISGNHKVKWQTDLVFFDVSPDLPDSTEDLDGATASGSSSTGFSTASSFSSAAAHLAAGEQGVMLRTQLQLSF